MNNNRYIAGVDVGTRMTKCAILDSQTEKVISTATILTRHNLALASEKVLQEACNSISLSQKEIFYIASTGYGRYQASMRQIQITDITCHAMGAKFLFPNTKNILDVGAQNAKAMRVDENGRVVKFKMNDKCASGAGSFLERVAKGLELQLDEVGTLSLRSKDPQPISSICAVLAESEVINLVTSGYPVEDILMGAHLSISDRIVAMLRQVGIEGEVTLTGGITKNVGMVKALEQKLGVKLNVNAQSEYAGAIGACVLVKKRLQKMGMTSVN
ncbi:MAG: 2-hydroxyglutaryl-CoA dehydratase [Ignavibacteria bacterium]|nr:2-hydroxyglutaryl-CoA dehydratase [Ignavibacteria bacterium]